MNLGPAFFQNMGWPEALLILAVALLFFGAARLPELGRSAAKTIREFKKGMKEENPPEEKPKNDEKKPTD